MSQESAMMKMNGNGLNPVLESLRALHDDESGATATEYIILLILIACVVIVIVKAYGVTVSRKFQASDELVRKEVVY
jgi:pilus assembly protein Flp/PilA